MELLSSAHMMPARPKHSPSKMGMLPALSQLGSGGFRAIASRIRQGSAFLPMAQKSSGRLGGEEGGSTHLWVSPCVFVSACASASLNL